MILKGERYTDQRGTITFNNHFDTAIIRRIYTIENYSTDFIRGWQGHRIERRWFAAIKGAFKIFVIEVDDFDSPSKDLEIKNHFLDEDTLTYLHVRAGCVTAIQSRVPGSKLLVLADCIRGEVYDEYRFDLNYFINLSV